MGQSSTSGDIDLAATPEGGDADTYDHNVHDLQRRPVTFLDLPEDILQTIFRKLLSSADLTNLARCHSSLHNLVTPLIYSRFDIVWPDVATGEISRGGVDALTYGLSTLVMAEDVFGEAPWQRARVDGGSSPAPSAALSETQLRRRRGNYYSRYIRKFALGNGPRSWVEDYLLTKEGGKMLGTLVALALARMRSLETFIWDMPTGVPRDVWASLSYLGEISDRLESVSVRWHDNQYRRFASTSPGTISGTLTATASASASAPAGACLHRVEHPSFSILPPLKSLSVLAIDELAYLDEMSVLICRSVHKLRELKIGIAPHAISEDWIRPWSEDSSRQIDLAQPTKSTASISDKRLGGVLGVLTSGFYDIRRAQKTLQYEPEASSGKALPLHNLPPTLPLNTPVTPAPETPVIEAHSDGDTTLGDSELHDLSTISEDRPASETSATGVGKVEVSSKHDPENESLHHPRLALETLTFENCILHLPTLNAAIDWSRLTSLTLLKCPENQSELWKMLTRRLCSVDGKASIPIRHLHTDKCSNSLLTFIHTLPKDSLSDFFIQSADVSLIDIDLIFRKAVKHHKSSLRRLLIDSMARPIDRSRTTRWRAWALSRPMIEYILGPRMPCLIELGCAVNHRHDWHFFIQRLPYAPQLQSLHVTRVADRLRSRHAVRELGLQILDIIVLRPEMHLRFIGLMTKCYEIYTGRGENERSLRSGDAPVAVVTDDTDDDEDDDDMSGSEDEDEEEEEMTDEEDGEDDGADVVPHFLDVLEGNDNVGAAELAIAQLAHHNLHNLHHHHHHHHHHNGHQHHHHHQHVSQHVHVQQEASDVSEWEDSDDESMPERRAESDLRLREILFYDEKVQIFKARHGKL